MKKSRNLVFCIAVLTVILLSLSLSVAFTNGQYVTQQTADVTVPSNGVAHVGQSSTVGGVSIDIAGTPGSTGSVSTATYLENPQPDASAPADVTLIHFVVVSFNIAPSDFQGANITISYSDVNVTGLSMPYMLYKYIPETNSYVQLNAVVDTAAKTITASVSSTTDPLFAIGGATATAPFSALPVWTLAIVVVLVVGVILVTVLILRSHRKPDFDTLPPNATP